jgi:hypothetical protein
VVVYGESNVFGSGVSDSETLPWRLSEILGEPVYNAARGNLYAVLESGRFPKPEWVVECVGERRLDGKYDPVLTGRTVATLRRSECSTWEALNAVPGERYRFHGLLRRWGENLVNDWDEWKQAGFDPRNLRTMDLPEYRRTPSDLDLPVRMIAKRKKWMEQRGIRYLFVPLPDKWVLEGTAADETTRNFTGYLVERLRREGVSAIDLGPVFRARHGERVLHHRFDTHVNAAGLDLAAREIAAHLQARRPRADRKPAP